MTPGTEAIGGQTTEFPLEADAPPVSHLASATAAQSVCRFFQREIVADTVVKPRPCPDRDPRKCVSVRMDTIITFDTVDVKVREYNGAVYEEPKYTFEDGAQVVDMQPYHARHQKVRDLVIWTCDEGYDPLLALQLTPHQESWVYRLHLRKDPWGIAGEDEWVVALHADAEFPDDLTWGATQRVGQLSLVEDEDGVIVTRASAGLMLQIRERPCRPLDGDDCVDLGH